MSRTDLSARQGTEEARSVAQGPVMPIGGAVDTDGHSDILARFVTLAGDGCPEAPRSGMVAIVDGRDARSDSFERDGGEVLTVTDAHLSELGPGRRFDLRQRRAVME